MTHIAADRHRVARALDEIAQYLELDAKNTFRARAYEKAARQIESVRGDFGAFIESGELMRTPGIGKAIGPIIEELARTGSSKYLESLRAEYPAGILELIRVPGLGFRKIQLLHEKLGVSSLDDLERVAADGSLAKLPGFGAKTAEKIVRSLETMRAHATRALLPDADDSARVLASILSEIDGVANVQTTGEIRRRLEVVDTVELLAVSTKPLDVLRSILSQETLERAERSGRDSVTGFIRGIAVEIHAVTPADLPRALLFTTGSDAFVEGLTALASDRGFTLARDRFAKGSKTLRPESERDLFAELGVPYVPPELREEESPIRPGSAEIRIISRGDIRGTFHMHTTWSDGRNSVGEMLAAAQRSGFEYIGVSDHSKFAAYAGGLTESQLAEQQSEIDAEKKSFGDLRVFKGTEADILADGAIDYDTKTLSSFDFVIASVHSRFNMAPDEMTDRIVAAVSNPFVTFLGHITGRLLLSRAGYTFDFDRVFEAAAERGVMVEINGDPRRLDLDWRRIRRALDFGVTFSIHPDAHSTGSLGYVSNGVDVARKGGLAPEQIFNTRPVEEVADYLKKRRQRAMKAVS